MEQSLAMGQSYSYVVPKNKRKLSSQRYFGAAKIVSKRARKGFSIKLNIDAHWSCAFYKALDYLQLRDGLLGILTIEN